MSTKLEVSTDIINGLNDPKAIGAFKLKPVADKYKNKNELGLFFEMKNHLRDKKIIQSGTNHLELTELGIKLAGDNKKISNYI